MTQSTLQTKGTRLGKKWWALILGVALTIASAIVSNYFIAKNNDMVAEWEREATTVNQQIDAIWENTRSLERRKDTAILLLIKDANHPESRAFIIDTLALFGVQQSTDLSYQLIQESFHEYKGEVLERIDDRFLVKQNYLEQAQTVRSDNDVLVNVALCFQILGLIFVLSRGGE
ncbi:hypothetical protein ISG33_08650 [Glaciecola sp. MH2013]|uniref:hypothetical protein n=1 Tax=Glaciecola sp. MH2013 TaxID=2785524 RepID=UPI00189DC6B0|nr:hypothetical protein [Glaciecola sp. MH2013]MBF7073462.1 hypothetical protein [Glaciecola sp. MH2013]